jgi:hypothetical protein
VGAGGRAGGRAGGDRRVRRRGDTRVARGATRCARPLPPPASSPGGCTAAARHAPHTGRARPERFEPGGPEGVSVPVLCAQHPPPRSPGCVSARSRPPGPPAGPLRDLFRPVSRSRDKLHQFTKSSWATLHDGLRATTKNNPRSEFPNTTMAFHRAFLLAAMAVAAVVNPAPTHANERGRAVASMRHRICATARCPPLFPAAACCNSWGATGL